MGGSTEYTRLHISPLSAALLPSILPPSILPNARNITYHQIQAFPDRPYGFLDLPDMDASKIKTKLNGSILKGHKIKIETAKPKHEFVPEEPEPEKPKREKKKRKREEIPGAEIGERSVKRGWSTPGMMKNEDKKKRKVKSKYTTGKECLFKTVLPPNVAVNTESADRKEKKRKGKGRETIIHEFEKTTKYPTFLRASATESKKKGAREFVEGKGWIDEDGEVIESVVMKGKLCNETAGDSKSRANVSTKEDLGVKAPAKVDMASQSAEETDEDTSSSGSSSDDDFDSEEAPTPAKAELRVQTTQATKEDDSSTSSSGSSDDDSPENE